MGAFAIITGPSRAPEARAADPATCLGGRYRLLRPLGGGAHTAVFAAWDLDARRAVAVKSLRDTVGRTEAAELYAEAWCLGRVQHPHLPRLDAVCLDAAAPYLVLESLDPQTECDRVTEYGPLSVADAVLSISELGAALQHLHDAGFVHRDVSARHVLRGHDGRAVLVDLGLCLHRDEVEAEGARALGSPEYMAPEVLLGPMRSFDAWRLADQYALGVLSYLLLTGSAPFSARAGASVLWAHRETVPPAPSARHDAVPPAVDAAVLRAMTRSPESRYGSVAEFCEALREGASGVAGMNPPTQYISGVFARTDEGYVPVDDARFEDGAPRSAEG